MNNSTASEIHTSTYGQYVGFGFVAIITNLIIVYVLFHNVQLLAKSAFIFGLAVADMINGMALFTTGIMRLYYDNSGKSHELVHPIECLQRFTTLWLIGVQLPPLMLTFMGVDRMVAIVCFMWYFKKWANFIPWIMTLAAYALCALSLMAVWLVVYSLPDHVTTSINCVTPFVVGPVYSSYNYGVAIVCGIAASTVTSFALTTFLFRKKKLQHMNLLGHMTKQWRLTVCMMCLALLDFCLVVIPNILLLLIGTFLFHFPKSLGNVGLWSASIFCVKSASNLFVYLLLNREFRRAFEKLFGINNVVAVAIPAQPQR